LSKRALPLLTGGLNELTRSDLIEDSQLQQCDNYEIIGDGTLHRRKAVETFDQSLEDKLFGTGSQKETSTNGSTNTFIVTDYGLFGEGSLLKISEPYYFPTDIDLTNSSYSTLKTDYILLVYGRVDANDTYEMHMIYKVDNEWTDIVVYNDDDSTKNLTELLTDNGIIYTSDSDPQFAIADDKVIITDGVNNAHYVAIDEDGIGRAGKMGLPAPRNRARIEQLTTVDKTMFETDTTQTYIASPGLVQVTYTAVTKYGDESNPAPLSRTFDIQYNKFGDDGITSHYIDKIKVHDLTVPDVPENIMETVKYFNFYMRIVPYKAGVEVSSLIFTEQQLITTKTKSGSDTGNSYVLTLPPLGGNVSYENDIAPIAKTASQLGGITILGNVKDNVRFPWSFKYFHPIKISNKDAASYVDANFILRLYDKDSDHANAIENLDLDDWIYASQATEAIFGGTDADTETKHFRFFDENMTTPLYVAFVKADDGEGKPSSYKTIDDVYPGEEGVKYVDLIVQIPYLTANSTRTIYLCWTQEADRSQYTGVDDDYNQLLSNDFTWNGNIGIHYGRVMTINEDDFDRQEFFKGGMLDDDQTYISYPMDLTFEGKIANRANLNNKLSDTVDFTNNDISVVSNDMSFIRGFKVSEKWSNRINTSTKSVGKNAIKIGSGLFDGAFLHGNQYDGASMDGQAGWVSFMFDGRGGNVHESSSSLTKTYTICDIWGYERESGYELYVGRDSIRLYVRRFQDSDSSTSITSDYYLYLDDNRNQADPDEKIWLGSDFLLYDPLGDTNAQKSLRYFLLTWKSDASEVTLWSYNSDGIIVYKTVDWNFEKLTDGNFQGVTLGSTSNEGIAGLPKAVYNDVQMQLGEYLDPGDSDSRARFANIVNQFPAYDNIIGYKHPESQDQLDEAYNNNIKFTETETTELKTRKNMVRWSDINRNAFPDLFFKFVREPVLKIVSAPSFLQFQYQNTFLIYTRNSISRFVLEGNASGWQGSSSSLIEEKQQYGLYAPETLVRIGEALFWLSEVGVVMWDREGLKLISKNIINVPIDKTYFAFENSIRNQYILSQKHPDTEQFVYHVDRGVWTKFNNMGNGTIQGITQAISLAGGEQEENINLIYGHDEDRNIYKYPSSNYTNKDSTVKTKKMFFEKGVVKRVKLGHTGNGSMKSILTKDNGSFTEITKTHTIDDIEINKWRGIPLGYNRGKSVEFQVDNADTIESIMYDLDIQAEVVV
jgi:hypothetical protein